MSVISQLNDACFVEANQLVRGLADVFEEEVGRRPTVDEFSELLYWGLATCSTEVFADAACQLTESVRINVRKAARSKLAPGDLFAIPRKHGGYFLAVYLAHNGRFGDAYGFLNGVHTLRPPANIGQLELLGPPIYSGTRAVKEGVWIFLGNFKDASSLFDANVPIYHAKRYHPDNDKIGPFGTAEYIDGTLRHLDAVEAEEVGLLDRSYSTSVLEEDVPQLLESRLQELRDRD